MQHNKWIRTSISTFSSFEATSLARDRVTESPPAQGMENKVRIKRRPDGVFDLIVWERKIPEIADE